MKYTPEQIGKIIRNTRKAMGVTQADLALTSGTGQRFISDLEKGKPTCQLGKVLTVLHTLGIKIHLFPPVELDASSGKRSSLDNEAGNNYSSEEE